MHQLHHAPNYRLARTRLTEPPWQQGSLDKPVPQIVRKRVFPALRASERGRFFEPPWPQRSLATPVPAYVRPRVKPTLRARPGDLRVFDPPWPQGPLTVWIPESYRQRGKPLLLRRGHVTEPPFSIPVPPAVPQYVRPRVNPHLRRRGRQFEPPLSDVNYCLPTYIRRRGKPLLLRRGRVVDVVAPQVPTFVVPPAYTRPRVNPHLRRRAHFFEPGWPQGAQGGGGPTLITRPMMGAGL